MGVLLMNLINPKLSPVRMLFVLLSLACMVMIFMFSMENSVESSETSGSVTEIAVKLLISDYENLSIPEQEEILSSAEHIVRKAAHFTIFAILGFCVSCAAGKRRLLSAATLLSLAVCFVYACSDELHQYFVPGRSCQFTDILVDTSGSICGILFSLLCICIFTRYKAKSSP